MSAATQAVSSSGLPEVMIRPAAQLGNGYGLLFAQDRYNPFQLSPLRGEDWQAGRFASGLLWARVADLESLPGGQRWWKPPIHPVALYCEFTAGGSIALIVSSDALVVTRPQRSPYRVSRITP
ncbi:hypothetical protein [Streptosporangium carneum]|uniref:Uncharacterized protein n=1 Tax=Streptosporangium carneum TaxID=47481 RepID=A0A9W6HYQ2_9ACTN|nr:hypothetical protein [Streptosporangium carneum]GLK07819.1 hypothetical protein GCM10017600_12240 [Streptosporangium carneum]